MSGPRSNLSYHPRAVRLRVYALHYDGATVETIVNDPEVAASIVKTGRRLHGSSLAAEWRKSDGEYAHYVADRERMDAAHMADDITRRCLTDTDALGSVADVARYELARQLRELIADRTIAGGDDGDGDPVQRLERLARTLAALVKDEANRDKAKIRELSEKLAEAERKNREQNTRAGGLTPETLRQIEEKAGLL